MATALDHVALANRNQDALEFLSRDSERFPEWITTVAFYKALHVVDAMLDAHGVNPPSDHGDRFRKLKNNRRYATVFKHYRVLAGASSVARYLSDQFGKEYRQFSDYLTPERVLSQMVRHRLHSVEKSATSLVKKDVFNTLTRAV